MSCPPAESRTAHLQQQALRLQTQLQQAQVRQAQTDAEVQRQLPAVAVAVAAIQRRFATHAAHARTAAMQRARQRAWGPALRLRPFLPDIRWRLALLGVLLLILPWMSARWFGASHAAMEGWHQLGAHGHILPLLECALLDRHIPIALPDHAARTAIVGRLLRGKPLAFDADTAAAWVAERSEGHYSGRDLHTCINRAMRSAARRALQESDAVASTRLQWDDLVATANTAPF